MHRRIVTGGAVLALLAMGGCDSTPVDDSAGPSPAPTTVAPSVPSTPASTATEAPSADASGVPSGPPSATPLADPVFEEYPLAAGTRPHDVAPALDGRVWFTAQGGGALGLLDPATGEVEEVPLGDGSAPHGVIVGPDGDAWVTDGGRNAIQRVDADDLTVQEFPLAGAAANLNTATFDGQGRLWFTGQAGVYGSVDPASGEVAEFDAPRGGGPYGIATTPDGTVWFASLAGSYLARIDDADGSLSTFDVPSPDGGARRVWSDSGGDLWVTEWFAGRLARFDPDTQTWTEWDLPTDGARPYAVWVDEHDDVWVTDFTADALVRFDPDTEEFREFPWPTPGAEVRQLLGRPGEVWGVGSATNTAIVLRTAS